MNRQQAINYLFYSGFSKEQINTIEQAFKQEPTTKNDLGVDKFDKAINQSDLKEWIMETFPDWCEGDVRLIMNHMDEMPSVTPQERTGHWIEKGKTDIAYDMCGYKSWATKYMCNHCGFIHTAIENHGVYSYCPNCGADMREVEV